MVTTTGGVGGYWYLLGKAQGAGELPTEPRTTGKHPAPHTMGLQWGLGWTPTGEQISQAWPHVSETLGRSGRRIVKGQIIKRKKLLLKVGIKIS